MSSPFLNLSLNSSTLVLAVSHVLDAFSEIINLAYSSKRHANRLHFDASLQASDSLCRFSLCTGNVGCLQYKPRDCV